MLIGIKRTMSGGMNIFLEKSRVGFFSGPFFSAHFKGLKTDRIVKK